MPNKLTAKQKLAIKAICYACKDNNPDYFFMREYVEWKRKPFEILEKIGYLEAIDILQEMIKE